MVNEIMPNFDIAKICSLVVLLSQLGCTVAMFVNTRRKHYLVDLVSFQHSFIPHVFFMKMVRKGKNTSFDTRQLVIYNREKGKSYREIGTLLNLSKSTVADIIRRYNREDRIESVAQTDRPKLLDIRDKRKIIRKVNKDPKLSAPRLAAEFA